MAPQTAQQKSRREQAAKLHATMAERRAETEASARVQALQTCKRNVQEAQLALSSHLSRLAHARWAIASLAALVHTPVSALSAMFQYTLLYTLLCTFSLVALAGPTLASPHPRHVPMQLCRQRCATRRSGLRPRFSGKDGCIWRC